MIKIFLCGFWGDFDKNNFFKLFFDKINYEFTESINKSDIIFVAPFLDKSNCNKLLNDNNKPKLLFISEPIEHVRPRLFHLINNNKYNMLFGCIENNLSKSFYKYPLYLFKIDVFDSTVFKKINEYVKNTNLDEKKYCCLINSHDNGKTRTPIYLELKKYGCIDCPGKLLNNCSNETLDKIGNAEFLKNYLFNICPENFTCKLPGYITEKIMNCCLGGSIPIYFGSFDVIDSRIFNKNRIIFYDPFNKESVIKTANFVRELLNDKNKLETFYRQDVFCDRAFEQIQELLVSLRNKIKELCN